jgi:hypothetical protein
MAGETSRDVRCAVEMAADAAGTTEDFEILCKSIHGIIPTMTTKHDDNQGAHDRKMNYTGQRRKEHGLNRILLKDSRHNRSERKSSRNISQRAQAVAD